MTDRELALQNFIRIGGHTSGYGLAIWISRALGVHVQTVKVWPADDWPDYARSSLELLTRLDPADWPERWQK